MAIGVKGGACLVPAFCPANLLNRPRAEQPLFDRAGLLAIHRWLDQRRAAPLEGGEIDGLNPKGAGAGALVLTCQPTQGGG
jgi:hypothetical protein